MQTKDFVAHVLFDENEQPVQEQSLINHLTGTARLAEDFADAFHARAWGRAAGLLHDVGKSSAAGQRRMRDPQHAPKCDHSTRGAQLAFTGMRGPRTLKGNPILPYVIAGHHGGLPDGGTRNGIPEGAALTDRVLCKKVPDCAEFLADWTVQLPDVRTLADVLRPHGAGQRIEPYSVAFFTRMLYSCLVDADYLDTERFLRPAQAARGAFEAVPVLEARLRAYMEQFSGKTGVLNEARAGILLRCLEAALRDAPGLFTLTVPTGGGKTLASLFFALCHARQYGMKRVIYAIPYTSILEQTVDVFGKAVGRDQVVAHYADAFIDDREEDWADDALHRRHLASENWDAPLIVTTNVQLFESLYGAKPSRCRKLHHLANSVIVLDEAQLLPPDMLRPCLRALEELTVSYGATVVLMSATQPELHRVMTGGLPLREISRDISGTYALLKRAQIENDGEQTLEAIAEKMAATPQALCIVNTRARARALYELLPEEGRFHLSTLMRPDDRRRVLSIIRQRLKDGLPCRLCATSLVEAGVDVDFPVGYREISGLDSLLQAAGRINREGLRAALDSVLHVFRVPGARLQTDVMRRAAVTQTIFARFLDVTAPEAIAAYFTELYAMTGDKALDKPEALEAFSNADWLFPFREVAARFRLIADDTLPVVIPAKGEAGEALKARLLNGDADRALLRQAGASAVNLRPYDIGKLGASVQMVAERMYLLTDDARYNPDLGLDISLQEGVGCFY